GMMGNQVEVKPGGMVYLYGVPLKQMICVAYHLAWWQVPGGEPWVEKVEYNVVAKAPEISGKPYDLRYSLIGIQDERLRAMVQTLLADRFQLKVHRETKAGRVYLLELNGKPLRLKPATTVKTVRQDDGPDAEPSANQEAGAFSSIGWAGSWVIADTTMPQLAKFAGDFYVHRPVLDRTGMTGAFDYRSTPEDNTAFWQDQTGSFLRMLGDTGLKLTPGEGPVETLVIDHAEAPSPN
ncbi:MAG: TIGR03435 family protein, partial [Acidobacteriaceae bacterium]